MRVTRARITPEEFRITGEIIEIEPGFDDEELLDDERMIDEDYMLDEDAHFSFLLSYLFGMTVVESNSNISLDHQGNFHAFEFIEGAEVTFIEIDQYRVVRIQGEIQEGRV